MNDKQWFKYKKKRVIRQYRSNQGRNPKKEIETFKILKVAFLIFGLVLLYLLTH